VHVAGDGDVSAYGVALNAERVEGSPGAGLFVAEAPDVESVAGWADFDVVAGVVGNEVFGFVVEDATFDAVVEVDAADALTEDVSESDAGA